MDIITGQALIDWGVKPGAHFKAAIATANRMQAEGADRPAILAAVQALVPATIPMRTAPIPYFRAIDAETDIEGANVQAVFKHVDELMRVPTARAGAMNCRRTRRHAGKRRQRLERLHRYPLLRHFAIDGKVRNIIAMSLRSVQFVA